MSRTIHTDPYPYPKCDRDIELSRDRLWELYYPKKTFRCPHCGTELCVTGDELGEDYEWHFWLESV